MRADLEKLAAVLRLGQSTKHDGELRAAIDRALAILEQRILPALDEQDRQLERDEHHQGVHDDGYPVEIIGVVDRTTAKAAYIRVRSIGWLGEFYDAPTALWLPRSQLHAGDLQRALTDPDRLSSVRCTAWIATRQGWLRAAA